MSAPVARLRPRRQVALTALDAHSSYLPEQLAEAHIRPRGDDAQQTQRHGFRDDLALETMALLLAHALPAFPVGARPTPAFFTMVATEAYAAADAMLVVRHRPAPEVEP